MHPFKFGLLLMFLCSVMVYLWNCIKGLCGDIQVMDLLAWTMECILSICMLINGLFSTYLSVILMWTLSVVCVYTTDELEKPLRKSEKRKPNQGEISPSKEKRMVSATADSIVNAEKFMDLFQVWLYEEQNATTEPLEEKIYKLQSACKQLKKVQIIIESLKTQALYKSQKDIRKSMRTHDLFDKFDYIKAYMELRQHLLTLVEKQLFVFLEQGKELKIWLSEASEIQEDLHHITCDSRLVVQQQLSQIQVIKKQSNMIAGKLETYKSTVNQLTATLQEIGSFSDGLQIALRKDIGPHQKRWSDNLKNSVREEMTQVGERFSTVLKLNACYQTHLQGLL